MLSEFGKVCFVEPYDDDDDEELTSVASFSEWEI
jgi:hypothetical protein